MEQVEAAGARPVVIDPERLPLFEGQPVPDNVYTLGVAATQTRLGEVVSPAAMAEVIARPLEAGRRRATCLRSTQPRRWRRHERVPRADLRGPDERP